MRTPPEDQDGIGSSGEEYRRALRFGVKRNPAGDSFAFEKVVFNFKVEG